jgi:hypothetical protein
MKRKKKRKLRGPDPKAEAWAKRNVWFGKDNDLTYRAFETHARLTKLRVNPRTKLYYSLIDLIMFPHIIKWKGGHLSPLQKRIAKKLGVPLKAYR